MQIATDVDGREITYDEDRLEFRVGDLPITLERLLAYDRGGQVTWVSDEMRVWAVEAHVAQLPESAPAPAQAGDVSIQAAMPATLVPCQECGHQMSRQAVRCPNCGALGQHHAQAKDSNIKTVLVVVGTFVGILFTCACASMAVFQGINIAVMSWINSLFAM